MVNHNVIIIKYKKKTSEGKYTYRGIIDKLTENLQFKLLKCKIKKFKVRRRKREILIYSEDQINTLKHVTTVFGVVSTSPAIEVDMDIHEITSIGSQAVTKKISKGCTFTVKAKGEFKNLPFTSRDIEVCLSAEILLKAEEKKLKILELIQENHILRSLLMLEIRNHIYTLKNIRVLEDYHMVLEEKFYQ